MFTDKLSVYVAGIPTRISREEILAYFNQFGCIDWIETFAHPEGKSTHIKGYCVLTTSSWQTYSSILSQPKHSMFGRSIVCTKYQEGSKLMRLNRLNNQRRVILRNVGSITKLDDLKAHLEKNIGKIEVIYEFKENSINKPLVSNQQSPAGFQPSHESDLMQGFKSFSVMFYNKLVAQELIQHGFVDGLNFRTYTVEKFKPNSTTQKCPKAHVDKELQSTYSPSINTKGALSNNKQPQFSCISTTVESATPASPYLESFGSEYKPSTLSYFELRFLNPQSFKYPAHSDSNLRFNNVSASRIFNPQAGHEEPAQTNALLRVQLRAIV